MGEKVFNADLRLLYRKKEDILNQPQVNTHKNPAIIHKIRIKC